MDFIAVWVGSKEVLGKVKALLPNHLWFGFENTACARTGRDDYAMAKKVGGLNLTSPEDAMKAPMSKWIVQALHPVIQTYKFS